MRFEQSFVIQAPPDRVWAFLTDPYRAAGALPGAAVTEKVDDKTFAGTITVKVGPVKTTYKGQATFEKLDAAAYVVEMTGSGQDVKGRGGADMKMTSHLVPRDGGTEVSVVSDVTVTGILTQFGRGMMQDVSDQLFKRFVEKARAELEQEQEASAGTEATAAVASASTSPTGVRGSEPEALDGVSLGAAVAASVGRRWVGHPLFWVAVVVAAAVVYFLAR